MISELDPLALHCVLLRLYVCMTNEGAGCMPSAKCAWNMLEFTNIVSRYRNSRIKRLSARRVIELELSHPNSELRLFCVCYTPCSMCFFGPILYNRITIQGEWYKIRSFNDTLVQYTSVEHKVRRIKQVASTCSILSAFDRWCIL